MGLRRIAFAQDVMVRDVTGIIEPLSALKRRGNPPQRWHNPARGVQWDGCEVRLQCYDKRLAILNRFPRLREDWKVYRERPVSRTRVFAWTKDVVHRSAAVEGGAAAVAT